MFSPLITHGRTCLDEYLTKKIGNFPPPLCLHWELFNSPDKKSQIVGRLVTHSGKSCVYTKIMFCQHFRIVEKKLAEGSLYLVCNGIYNGKILQKLKIFILATKIHLYELICHPHIEENQT